MYKKKNQKDETVVEVKKETTQRMDIYTQEELDELEEKLLQLAIQTDD